MKSLVMQTGSKGNSSSTSNSTSSGGISYSPCDRSGAAGICVSSAQFDDFLSVGQLFQTEIPPDTASTSTPSSVKQAFARRTLNQLGKLGTDLQDIHQYFQSRPNAGLGKMMNRLLSTPMSMGSVTAKISRDHGKFQKIRLLGKETMIRALAQSIRHSQSSPIGNQAPLARSSTPNRATQVQPVTCDVSTPPSASTMPSSVLCSKSSAVGAGLGWDSDPTSNLSIQAKNSLIAQCSFPMKSALSCVKNQGDRSTSSAFAMNGAVESLVQFTLNTGEVNLSEQALYFEEKANWDAANSNNGDFGALDLATQLSKSQFFIPFESQWDYNPSLCKNLNGATDNSGSCDNSCSDKFQSQSFGTTYSEYCSDNESQGLFLCEPSGRCGYLSQVSTNNRGAQVTNFVSLWSEPNTSSTGGSSNSSADTVPQDSINNVISNLNQGNPVLATFWMTQGFLDAAQQGGIVPDPVDASSFLDSSGQVLGGHVVLIVGYIPSSQLGQQASVYPSSSTGGMFILKNSWGPTVGDAGYFYVSDQFLIQTGIELVAITSVTYQ